MIFHRIFSLSISTAILLTLPFGTQAAEPAPQEPLRLLHIGNSFSHDASRYLPALARVGGKKLYLYGATMPGGALEMHATHLREAKEGKEEGNVYPTNSMLGSPLKERKRISLSDALTARKWDIVTIQQASRASYQPDTFEPHASEIVAEIRSLAPQATLYIHQTWAYRSDHPLYQDTPELTPDRMQELINVAYEKLAKRYEITHFLPSGLAIHYANGSEKWRYQPDPDFDYANPPAGVRPAEISVYSGPILGRSADGASKLSFDRHHLGPIGSYLASCVWYEIIFDDSVIQVDFAPKGISAEDALELRKLAHQVVADYRKHGLAGASLTP